MRRGAKRRGVRLLTGVVVLVALDARAVRAQSLPAFVPINPVSTSRSALYFQPFVPARVGTAVNLSIDYASLVETPLDRPGYLLDAEVLRVELAATRDLGPSTFALLRASAGGAYAGFLDGFFDRYHRLFGIPFAEREGRPRNAFDYAVTVPDGRVVDRSPSRAFLGDLYIGIGRRFGRDARPVGRSDEGVDRRSGLQSVAAITLPTTTGAAGYGRRTVGVALLTTARRPIGERVAIEASLGLGATPSTGALAPIERTMFASGTLGCAVKIGRGNALHANLFLHTPQYRGSHFPQLDRGEISLDFGFAHTDARGRVWRIGLVEDPRVAGPSVDVVLRAGVSF